MISRNPFSSPSGELVSTFRSGVFDGDCRHDAIEESLVDRNLRLHELFDERLVLDRRRGLVARGIARIGGDAGVDVLIVAQREERHAHCRIAEADRRGGIGRILRVADSHAGVDVIRRCPQHHELGAAQVDVVMNRHHRHPRRLEPHLHIVRERTADGSQPEEHRAFSRDGDRCRAADQLGLRLLADRTRDGDAVRRVRVLVSSSGVTPSSDSTGIDCPFCSTTASRRVSRGPSFELPFTSASSPPVAGASTVNVREPD